MRLGKAAYEEVRKWVYRNARPLEMALWEALFEGGSPERATRILAAYQNEDGGFGNGFEPDLWTARSTPYTTYKALECLYKLGAPESAKDMAERALNYLAGIVWKGDLWPFTMPSDENAPHAPWWNPSEETNEVESAGLSASIALTVLRMADPNGDLYARAMRVAENAFLQTRPGSEMGTASLCALAETLGERFPERAEALADVVRPLVARDIERDSAKWPQHTHRPSEFISSPASPFYAGNEAILEQEFDFTIRDRAPGGVWPITWCWYDNQPKYADAFVIARHQWEGWIAIEKIALFKAFERL